MDVEEVVLSSSAIGTGTSGLWEWSLGCSSLSVNSVGGAATDMSEEEDEAGTEE
jgi:hypothetical protein